VTSEWAQFFDRHAPQYDDNCFTKNTLAEVDFLLAELQVPAGAAVLDIGCGTGRHAVELAKRGLRVTGVDLSEGMLAQARRRAREAGVDVTWHCADATTFRTTQAFDAAICLCEGAFGLLGTAQRPVSQPLAILRTAAAALKPGARCLFTVLNGCAIVRKHTNADVASGVFDVLGMHEESDVAVTGMPPGTLRERGFVPTELTLLFALAGLRVTAIYGGTAGAWGARAIDLDEIEIMVLAAKPAAPVSLDQLLADL